MKSKIRVEYDFDRKEPYLQITLPKINQAADLDEVDMRDQMLKNFVQTTSLHDKLLILSYPERNVDNSIVNIRIGEKTRDYFLSAVSDVRILFHSLGQGCDSDDINQFFDKWEKKYDDSMLTDANVSQVGHN